MNIKLVQVSRSTYATLCKGYFLQAPDNQSIKQVNLMLSTSKLMGLELLKRALLHQLSYELVQGRYLQTNTG